MSDNQDPQSLAELMERRNASLYCACQLRDFEGFLRQGAISSPVARPQPDADLNGTEATVPAQSPSAASRRVILRLADAGEGFAKKLQQTPNPDGPILFQVNPDILRHSQHMRVVLTPEYGRRAKDIPLAAEDTEYLFRYTDQAPYPERLQIKTGSQIQKTFKTAGPMVPEIRCRIPGGVPFSQVSATMVDNYLIFKRQLRDWAYDLQRLYGTSLPLKRRYCPADIGGHLADALAARLLTGPVRLESLYQDETPLSDWAAQLRKQGLADLFQRFAENLRNGTLLYIQAHRERLWTAKPVQNRFLGSISKAQRRLVDKLLAEKIPLAAIARIAELPETLLEDYLKGGRVQQP